MNSLPILEEVLEKRARELANKRLRDIAGMFWRRSNQPTPLKFKNKRLKQKWFRSLAATIEKHLFA